MNLDALPTDLMKGTPVMLWPALCALAYGHLTSDQLTWLLDNFGLTKNV